MMIDEKAKPEPLAVDDREIKRIIYKAIFDFNENTIGQSQAEDRIYEAIRSYLAQPKGETMRKSGCRPIEAAPKDGRKILIFDPIDEEYKIANWDKRAEKWYSGWNCQMDVPEYSEFTEWWELPQITRPGDD